MLRTAQFAKRWVYAQVYPFPPVVTSPAPQSPRDPWLQLLGFLTTEKHAVQKGNHWRYTDLIGYLRSKYEIGRSPAERHLERLLACGAAVPSKQGYFLEPNAHLLVEKAYLSAVVPAMIARSANHCQQLQHARLHAKMNQWGLPESEIGKGLAESVVTNRELDDAVTWQRIEKITESCRRFTIWVKQNHNTDPLYGDLAIPIQREDIIKACRTFGAAKGKSHDQDILRLLQWMYLIEKRGNRWLMNPADALEAEMRLRTLIMTLRADDVAQFVEEGMPAGSMTSLGSRFRNWDSNKKEEEERNLRNQFAYSLLKSMVGLMYGLDFFGPTGCGDYARGSRHRMKLPMRR